MKWTLSDKAVGDPAKELAANKGLAATYALSKCLKDGAYCTFTAEKNGASRAGSGECVRVYQPSNKDDTVTFREDETSSYSETIGSSVLTGMDITASVKFGDLGFESKFSKNWQSSISKTTGTATSYGSSAPQARKAGEYAWMIYRPLIGGPCRGLVGQAVGHHTAARVLRGDPGGSPRRIARPSRHARPATGHLP
ncbi:hypothetical protein Srufu_033670 [Streptomyces libani subsp. rufus]|nr:hypothetical protein Srufu_033670 [Streptomyces libani subsp. rufus]